MSQPPLEAFVGIDHVQLAIPSGGEERARAFFSGVLGFDELEKPAPLAARGGAWFTFGSGEIHVGVEDDFRPAKKAHPALRLASEAALRALAAHLEQNGHRVRFSGDVPGVIRFFMDDPFGNRLEFTARRDT